MFERFTEHAKHVTVFAQEEARRADHAFMTADHLWLGILTNNAAAGFALVKQLGIDPGDLRDRIREHTGRGPGSPAELTFAPDGRKALEFSLREALRLGDRCIGSEHVVLGLLREGTSHGATALKGRGTGVPEAEAALALIPRESLPPGDPFRSRWWRRER